MSWITPPPPPNTKKIPEVSFFEKAIDKIINKLKDIAKKSSFKCVRELYSFAVGTYCRYKRYQYNKSTKLLLNQNILKDKIKNLNQIINSPSKNFYCIARDADNVGLFSYVYTSLAHITYALAKGYVPVVDMQNYDNPYLESHKVGKENSWEYYFKQPFGYRLDDIGKMRCIKSSLNIFPTIPPYFDAFNDTDATDFWYTIYREYFILNESTERYVNEEYSKILKKNTRVLGVKCRGSDYTSQKPYGHYIQPDINCVIEKVRQSMQEWNLEYIYLSTDEIKTLRVFEDAFPNKILTNSQKYYDEFDYSNQYVTCAKFDRDNDAYLQGLEYLSSIVILSKCTCLVAGLCGGTFAAVYMNGGKYENKYIFDLGKYGVSTFEVTEQG